MMLADICEYLKNWFVDIRKGDIHTGIYAITDGILEGADDFLLPGQFFRIVGSVFNDGVYTHPASDLVDEVFDGELWAMRVPPEVQTIANEIEAWTAKNPESPFESESFGGYSYKKLLDTNGAAITWQSAFKARLSRWRKL